ncbi:MAG: peptidoglycan editing factor PgeF [Gammaproteobacteria bacterium]|nr:peptidoglycan editing factor PgeF [Gammaproteobacteria bacterium]MBU1554008.1 peptidoglycan editing factor PgeF [Gammaproteobacteria bacterium]MBU2069293.1 peptidoglycan editing factor PgeF [Gammaproteobacteria bacterium]MBU2183288.1 peptidoglycan editing factor PgeF [Gammaproteobacteria bacterium]MBU2204503.1 peptidoglycan editing factor PgeF [Gammaproteobacteria bacterium]
MIVPDWPAPANVRAVCSTRQGGCSAGVYASLNLGLHVNDNPQRVHENRHRYQQLAKMPASPVWLEQVHGVRVLPLDRHTVSGETADASVTTEPGVVATVMTADCLPLLLCDTQGTQVAAVHAGWRGLCNGVIEATVAQFAAPAQLMVYLGPAISQRAFEVGPDVRAAFMAHNAAAEAAFVAASNGKFFADLYFLARQRLQHCGVRQIYGGSFCTHQQTELFFSYRRDGQTGRMASSIWLD